MYKRFIIITLLLLFNSCADKQKKTIDNTIETNVDRPNNNLFSFSLNVNIPKDDTLRLFYGYIDEPFVEERAVYLNVQGNDKRQEIMFKLPKGEMPEKLRFHFGPKSRNQKIQIHWIEITNGHDIFRIENSDLKTFFNFSPYFTVDEVNQFITPVENNGVYDPHIVSNNNLNSKLSEMW